MWTLLVANALAEAPAPAAGGPGPAAEAPPRVEIRWRKDRATAVVTAPDGFKVADDAPAALDLAWGERSLRFETQGALLHGEIHLVDLRGAALEGALDVGICTLDGSECRPTSWSLAGQVPSARKGAVSLTVSAPHSAGSERPFGPGATAGAADAAFTRARQSGKAVLLDFSAVWCPPCNQLADEVLQGPPAPELDGYEVAVLDVDHPSSFALKDRYEVGGYPTVVVVDADGVEKSRFVGYPNREAFLAWLAGAAGSTDAADLGKAPEEVSPERAAALGWLLVQQGAAERANTWLGRASQGPDSVELRRLRFALEPTAADLEWLVENAPDHAMDLVGSAVELEAEAPELARTMVEHALRRARGVDVAAMLHYAAELAPDEATARAHHAAAASILRSALNGEPEHDKPYLSWLADEEELGGDPAAAVRTLEQAVATWPDEPTFDLALAPLLTRLGRHDEALASAERALRTAWGDNRLRAALAKAQVLVAMGRTEEAKQVAADELAAQPAPAEQDVRTHRYRQRLEAIMNPEATH